MEIEREREQVLNEFQIQTFLHRQTICRRVPSWTITRVVMQPEKGEREGGSKKKKELSHPSFPSSPQYPFFPWGSSRGGEEEEERRRWENRGDLLSSHSPSVHPNTLRGLFPPPHAQLPGKKAFSFIQIWEEATIHIPLHPQLWL